MAKKTKSKTKKTKKAKRAARSRKRKHSAGQGERAEEVGRQEGEADAPQGRSPEG